MPEARFARPQCDLVMRGGITSGIVYPRAIARLAKDYDFRCIGGTSVGAIAAAAAAATALGAKKGKDSFPTRLKSLPEELSEVDADGKTVLERLFQPQPGTSRLFRVFMASIGEENLLANVPRIIRALCLAYWPFALVGAAIALIPLLTFASTSVARGVTFGVLLTLGLLPALIFILAIAFVGALFDALRLPKLGYGIISGSSYRKSDNAKYREGGVLPLTDWLHELFQDVADRSRDEPVTFGNLWNNGNKEDAERDIELVLMTANVTRGVSHRFPFIEGGWGQLFFSKKEFEELFPEPVVRWMVDHAQKPRLEVHVPNGFYGLPKPADLPILLGARMSLSFPFVITAVPLYAVNTARFDKSRQKFELERCWFSDGGLISNFPMHLFDAPLPSRPTFGLNLVDASVALSERTEDEDLVTGFRPGGEPVEKRADDRWSNIYMPGTNHPHLGTMARFNQFTTIFGFFFAMFDTARNWADTELLPMPGYRDRIVHIALKQNEGGLNLRMRPSVIKSVAERGERAAELLVARFALNPGLDPQSGEEVKLTWDNQRWVRFRSFMAALEHVTRRLSATWMDTERQKPFKSYGELLERPPSYPLTRAQQSFASDAMNTLVELVGSWTRDRTFDRRNTAKGWSPRPKPILRMMPPGSNDPSA